MNIKDWQRAKEERERSRTGSPNGTAQGAPPIPARLDVLKAEFLAITSRPPQNEGDAAEKPNS